MKNNVWLALTDGLYMFGSGGVYRIEEYIGYDLNGQRSSLNTKLYFTNGTSTLVKESVNEIQELLRQWNA